MNFRLFQFPLPAPPELAELNTYLSSQRVTAVSHHFVESPGGPMIVFLVQSVAAEKSLQAKSEARIDYRKVLGPEEFARFSRLREERKVMAQEEALPVYAIFTNAQLAIMARENMNDVAQLHSIDGLGEGRIEKWGTRILKVLEVPK